jgi:hypothetical protein
MNNELDNLDDFIEIKAEVFWVIRAHSDCRNPKKVMRAIKDHLPDVDSSIVRKALVELYT